MKLANSLKLLSVGAILLAFSSLGHSAAEWEQWWLDCPSPGGSRCTSDTETATSAGGVTATVTAWGNSGSGNSYVTRSLHEYGGGLGSGATEGEGNPEHAFDNEGVHEFALIYFDWSIALEKIYLGWTGGDEDVSVLAYTGDDAFNINTKLAGLTSDQLGGAGWETISNFDAGGTGWSSVNNVDDIDSQYWLVGAFSSAFGSCSNCYGGNDYFKLKKLKGTHTPTDEQVPLPGTALLFGLGLLMVRARARKQH